MESLPNPNSSCARPPPDPALLHSNSWWHSLVKSRDRRGSAGFSANMGDEVNMPNRVDDDEGSGIALGRSLERVGISIPKNRSKTDLQKYEKGSPGSLKKKGGHLFLEVEKSPQGIQSGDIYDLVDMSSTGVMQNPSRPGDTDYRFTPSPIKKQEITAISKEKLVFEKKYHHDQYAGESEGQFFATEKKLPSSITEGDISIIKDKSSMKDTDSKWNNIKEVIGRHPEKLLRDNDSANTVPSKIAKNYMAKVSESSNSTTHYEKTILSTITKKPTVEDLDSDYTILPAITKKPIVEDSTKLPTPILPSTESLHYFEDHDSDYTILPAITKKHINKEFNSDCTILPAITKKNIVGDHDSDYTILPALTKKPTIKDPDSICTVIPAVTRKPVTKDAEEDSPIHPEIKVTSSSNSEETPEKKPTFLSRKLSSMLQSSLANNWFFQRESSEEESDIESTKSDDFSRSESEVSGSSSSPTTPTHGAPVLLRRNSKWNAVKDALYNHPEKLREMNTWQPQN